MPWPACCKMHLTTELCFFYNEGVIYFIYLLTTLCCRHIFTSECNSLFGSQETFKF